MSRRDLDELLALRNAHSPDSSNVQQDDPAWLVAGYAVQASEEACDVSRVSPSQYEFGQRILNPPRHGYGRTLGDVLVGELFLGHVG